MTAPALPIGIRWTIGDVSRRGFEALRLSMWGAYGIFGDDAAYAVCVNTVRAERARALAGETPEAIWIDAEGLTPDWLMPHLDEHAAEGVAWKFAPLRLFEDRWEISLDNDCILWTLPRALRSWLDGASTTQTVLAADVRVALGQFTDLCGPSFPPRPWNSGIRGLPPRFDLERALREALDEARKRRGAQVVLRSELDEQGLQAAALLRTSEVLAVSTEDVAICSPFHPHSPDLGQCGAHFVGLNARHVAWNYFDRPADEWMADHWRHHRPALERLVRCGRPAKAPAIAAAGRRSVRRYA